MRIVEVSEWTKGHFHLLSSRMMGHLDQNTQLTFTPVSGSTTTEGEAEREREREQEREKKRKKEEKSVCEREKRERL